jgi:hypothetical protein
MAHNVAAPMAPCTTESDEYPICKNWGIFRPHYSPMSHLASPREAQQPSLRERLISAMGLTFDPFSSGVSEKDLVPDFGAIYIDLQPSLLKDLQQPAASFVFADYGMGKTATRLALEYTLRLARSTPQTLSVTYTPDVGRARAAQASETPLLDQHLDAITREMHIDLLIQYIERLPERAGSDNMQRSLHMQQALQRQAQAASAILRQRIYMALRDTPPDGAIWRGIRPLVRHVAVTETWKALIQQLAAMMGTPGAHPSWKETIYDAQALGFQQTFALIDAVDDGMFDADDYFTVIKPLIAAMNHLQDQHIYLKCFLPLAVKEHVLNAEEMQVNTLTSHPRIATIDQVSSENLQKIIIDRLTAASTSSASFRSLDWLGPGLEESIQDRLVALAQGSPRHLIELVSAFLDFHSFHGFRDNERLWVAPAEWRRFQDEITHHHSDLRS